MEYCEILKHHAYHCKTLQDAKETDHPVRAKPHAVLRQAAEYFKETYVALLAFPHKVVGVPVVGFPPDVAAALENLSRRRICRQEVTVSEFMDKFNLDQDVATVATHLDEVTTLSHFDNAPSVITLCSGGRTNTAMAMSVGHVAHHLLSVPVRCDYTLDEVQNSLCVLASLAWTRIDNVWQVLGHAPSVGDVAKMPTSSIRKRLMQLGGPSTELEIHECGNVMFRKGALRISKLRQTEQGGLRISCVWTLPPSLNLTCCSFSKIDESEDSVCWTSMESVPVPVQFNPSRDPVKELEMVLSVQGNAGEIVGLNPLSYRTSSPVPAWKAILMTGFTFWIIHPDRFGAMGLFAMGYLYWLVGTLFPTAGTPHVSDILECWEMFESGQHAEQTEEITPLAPVEASSESSSSEDGFIKLRNKED